MEIVLFFVAAFGAIGGALGVILVRNPFYSVLSLVVHLFAMATLFLILRAEFIAAAQIVVYAGAVMVLYVFVVAYIGGVQEEPFGSDPGPIGKIGLPFAFGLFVVVTIAVIGTGLTAIDSEGAKTGFGFGSPGAIGELLLRKFLVAFEAASLLLLVAAVGAVVLARKRRGLPGAEGGAPANMLLSDSSDAARSNLLGGIDADPTRPSPGTAEGPLDPTPARPPS